MPNSQRGRMLNGTVTSAESLSRQPSSVDVNGTARQHHPVEVVRQQQAWAFEAAGTSATGAAPPISVNGVEMLLREEINELRQQLQQQEERVKDLERDLTSALASNGL